MARIARASSLIDERGHIRDAECWGFFGEPGRRLMWALQRSYPRPNRSARCRAGVWGAGGKGGQKIVRGTKRTLPRTQGQFFFFFLGSFWGEESVVRKPNELLHLSCAPHLGYCHKNTARKRSALL